jgi:hypothetical protein
MSSSAAQHADLSSLGFLPVSEKLTRGNFPLWHAQVLSSIRGAEVFEFLNPTAKPPAQYLPKKKPDDAEEVPILNEEYSAWVAKDQQVLSYLLVSLSREILQQVSTATTATAQGAARVPRLLRLALADNRGDPNDAAAADCLPAPGEATWAPVLLPVPRHMK